MIKLLANANSPIDAHWHKSGGWCFSFACAKWHKSPPTGRFGLKTSLYSPNRVFWRGLTSCQNFYRRNSKGQWTRPIKLARPDLIQKFLPSKLKGAMTRPIKLARLGVEVSTPSRQI